MRFTACFVPILMRAEELTDPHVNVFCGKQEGACVCRGKCGDAAPLHKKHEELNPLYTAVTDFGFLQIDLSNDEHMKPIGTKPAMLCSNSRERALCLRLFHSGS